MIARLAKYVAIGAVPLGLLLGFLLSLGQDAAGAGMIRGFAALLGIAVAVIAGLLYFLARADLRVPRVTLSGVRLNRGKTAVTVLVAAALIGALTVIPDSAPQNYGLSVTHRYDSDITGVVARIGEEERIFDRIGANVAANAWELQTPPETIEVWWADPRGVSHSVVTKVTGDVPRRYNNGHVRITIISPDEVRASFLFPK